MNAETATGGRSDALLSALFLVLGVLVTGCGSGSGGSGKPSGQGSSTPATSARSPSGTAARPPLGLSAAPEVSHFERIPMDAAEKAGKSLLAFLDTSATDMRAYHALRRAVSCGEPFLRERRVESEALFGPPDDPTNGPLGRLDTAMAKGDRQAIEREAAFVKRALLGVSMSFDKHHVDLPRVAVLLPKAAYTLGAIFAGSKPGLAATPKGVIADAQGHLDAIDQMVAFNRQYVSPNPEYGPAFDRVQKRLASLRKALSAAEQAGELTDRASLVVQTGHLGAELRALIGPSSDLWKPPAPAISALARPSPDGVAEPTSVLTLPRSFGPAASTASDPAKAGDPPKGAGSARPPSTEAPRFSGQSPLDRFARGDEKAFTEEDRRGFDVAAGKGRCLSCHLPPLFGVAEPPDFQRSLTAILGAPDKPGQKAPSAGAGKPASHVVLSLRDVAKTAPYFHHGVFPTLESVVDFYDAGAGRSVGVDSPDMSPSLHKLDLSAAEKRALLRFLRSALAEP